MTSCTGEIRQGDWNAPAPTSCSTGSSHRLPALNDSTRRSAANYLKFREALLGEGVEAPVLIVGEAFSARACNRWRTTRRSNAWAPM